MHTNVNTFLRNILDRLRSAERLQLLEVFFALIMHLDQEEWLISAENHKTAKNCCVLLNAAIYKRKHYSIQSEF